MTKYISKYTGKEIDALLTKADNIDVGIKYTGHLDEVGLKAIGWDDEDIAFFQEHGLCWNEEQDEYFKVSDRLKELYPTLTPSTNLKTLISDELWLPKIDYSQETSLNEKFREMSFIGVPRMNFSKITSYYEIFYQCNRLRAVPKIEFNLSKECTITRMFSNCANLKYIEPLIIRSTSLNSMFQQNYTLKELSITNISDNGVDLSTAFNSCYSLEKISLDINAVSKLDSTFTDTTNIKEVTLNLTANISTVYAAFSNCRNLVKVNFITKAPFYYKMSISYLFNGCFNLSQVIIDQPIITNSSLSQLANNCNMLISFPDLDISDVNTISGGFYNCSSLRRVNMKGLGVIIDLSTVSDNFETDCTLYAINNCNDEVASGIKFSVINYNRMLADERIVAALAAHPNFTISK